MSTPWILVRRNMRAHWLRSGLTVLSLTVAMFLLCFLISLVTSLDAAVTGAATNRIITQSAVSLFIELPGNYQQKIAAVPGVQDVTKFQWFGAYYQNRENFTTEFGIDHDVFFDMYDGDIEITAGPDGITGAEARQAVIEAVAADRRAAVMGEALMEQHGWSIGETIPLIGTVFPHPGGGAWEFNIVGTYLPRKTSMDDRTVFFRYDYLDETLDAGDPIWESTVGVYSVNVADGYDPAQVIAGIDGLFENGPQVTMTSTEAAFQAGFVSMMGNLPFFVATIGGAVVFAVIFSVINTMLLSARQRTRETGILKALGYRDAAVSRLMLGESLLISLIGGGFGVLLAWGSAEGMRKAFSGMLPTYSVTPSTVAFGLVVAAVVGLVAGIAPAVMASRLHPTAALRSEG
ncbi:MAG: ABC transporter permease [Planctomycetota bacterium]|jgi:putative ABC transport system permease protein